jgi:hypothetical protein
LLDNIFEGQKFAAKGAIEDQKMVLLAQQVLLSDANEYLELNLFESAISHLHNHLAKKIELLAEFNSQPNLCSILNQAPL